MRVRVANIRSITGHNCQAQKDATATVHTQDAHHATSPLNLVKWLWFRAWHFILQFLVDMQEGWALHKEQHKGHANVHFFAKPGDWDHHALEPQMVAVSPKFSAHPQNTPSENLTCVSGMWVVLEIGFKLSELSLATMEHAPFGSVRAKFRYSYRKSSGHASRSTCRSCI